MTQQELNDLIDKVNNGTATDKELVLYTAYLNHITSGDEAWDVQELGTEESVKNELQNRIELIRKPIGVKKARLWPRIIGVAAAVAAIVFGIWLYTSSHLDDRRDLLTNTNDIAPGGNKATLSVNGKTIQLSEDKTGVIVGNDLKYNDGTALGSFANNEAAIKNITASTPRGGMYQITLPDGTRAWMNADSKISFPAQFIGKERKILLIGEAYFEVAKSKDKPFIVESEGQQVEVLGTHFNISAYKGEGIKTTLLEGSVKVWSVLSSGVNAKDLGSVTLKPNQQSIITGTKQITVKNVNASAIIDWKNGEFLFNDEPLESIMRRIARWYNADVIYQGIDPKETFGGSISRFENVSKVLENLELTGGIHFKIEGRKIIVTR